MTDVPSVDVEALQAEVHELEHQARPLLTQLRSLLDEAETVEEGDGELDDVLRRSEEVLDQMRPITEALQAAQARGSELQQFLDRLIGPRLPVPAERPSIRRLIEWRKAESPASERGLRIGELITRVALPQGIDSLRTMLASAEEELEAAGERVLEVSELLLSQAEVTEADWRAFDQASSEEAEAQYRCARLRAQIEHTERCDFSGVLPQAFR